jgi:hypothetical protein
MLDKVPTVYGWRSIAKTWRESPRRPQIQKNEFGLKNYVLHEFDIKKHVFMNLTSSPLTGAWGGGQRRGPDGEGHIALKFCFHEFDLVASYRCQGWRSTARTWRGRRRRSTTPPWPATRRPSVIKNKTKIIICFECACAVLSAHGLFWVCMRCFGCAYAVLFKCFECSCAVLFNLFECACPVLSLHALFFQIVWVRMRWFDCAMRCFECACADLIAQCAVLSEHALFWVRMRCFVQIAWVCMRCSVQMLWVDPPHCCWLRMQHRFYTLPQKLCKNLCDEF